MEPKVNYALVGLFVALLGTALLAVVLWLSRTDYRGVYDRYYTYMTELVSGLSRDAPPLTVKPGEEFPVIKSRPSFFFRLDHALSRVLDDESLPRLLANLNELAQDARGVVDAQSRSDLKRILADLAKITT